MMGDMEHTVWAVILGVFGLLFGSFAGASVWRLRARQLVADKKSGEEDVDEAELKRLKPLTKVTFRTDRSRCLHCGHELAWYDLLPLASWLSTGGKCRYCRKPIGYFEPLIELAVAAFFVSSFLLWPFAFTTPFAVIQFGVWLAAGVGLAILYAYDQKWFLLPDGIMFSVIGLAAMYAGMNVWQAADHVAALFSLAGAIVLLSGLYLLLYAVSKGRWVGFGDVKLGLALALLLGRWELAFIALFAANAIGTLVVLPGLLTRTLSRTARVPFGPFLILGMLVAFFAGPAVAAWYTGLVVW